MMRNLKVKPKNINEYENDLKKLLDLSVKEQMTSDVPYGSMLSGGIDSSLITSIMQNNSIKKLKPTPLVLKKMILMKLNMLKKFQII